MRMARTASPAAEIAAMVTDSSASLIARRVGHSLGSRWKAIFLLVIEITRWLDTEQDSG